MNEELAPALVLASSVEEDRSLIIVVEGGHEARVRDALAGLLDGTARPPLIALKCAELRARMPRLGGQWARALEWAGGTLKAFSYLGSAGSRGATRASHAGALDTGVTYTLSLATSAASAHEALAVLERELFAAWIPDRDTFDRDRGEPAPGGWSWNVRLESGRVLSVRLVSIA